MSVDLSHFFTADKSSHFASDLSSSLLIEVGSVSLKRVTAYIKKQLTQFFLLDNHGEILWHNGTTNIPTEEYFIQFCTTNGLNQFTPFSEPQCHQHGCYYIAPILTPDGKLCGMVALYERSLTQQDILMALAHSVGAQITASLQNHIDKTVDNSLNITEKLPQNLAIEYIEKEAIIDAAKLSKGKVQEMYKLLNIGRTTLWRKIKQYEIDIKQYK